MPEDTREQKLSDHDFYSLWWKDYFGAVNRGRSMSEAVCHAKAMADIRRSLAETLNNTTMVTLV